MTSPWNGVLRVAAMAQIESLSKASPLLVLNLKTSWKRHRKQPPTRLYQCNARIRLVRNALDAHFRALSVDLFDLHGDKSCGVPG